ncbi:methylated-DNA--[protein]-cysteine S-methyltransferase [Rhizobium sp. LjRoot254]|uniref:methylated-DNA--[protein]-cysteine S-methyltransferase n=1 Tax=Rhizobium sp. LjRoot254 TaxID=3342297 RepID=UPI003ED0B27F
MQIQTIMADHAIGPIHIVADGGRLIAMEFGDTEHRLMPMLRARFGKEPMLEPVDDLNEITSAIRAYFEGDLAALDAIEVDGGGTEFQRRAWEALRAIPPGETRTYGQMAAALGRPNAARAIGMANALNPVSLVVPCHRLVGSNGSLTGYGGGIARKRWLVDHERRHASQIQLRVVA